MPSHAWNRWRYHYPQAAFPYEDLIAENGRRGKLDPEYELLDTGVFDDDRYWIVEVDYAKADPDRPADDGPGHQRRSRRRHAARAADGVVPQHVVVGRRRGRSRRCAPRADGAVAIDHPFLGELRAAGRRRARRRRRPTLLFCENETNVARLYGAAGHAVPEGRHQRPRRARRAPRSTPTGAGTKVACWYRLDVAPGATVELRLRLRPAGRDQLGRRAAALGADFDAVVQPRRAGGRRVLRRADAGRTPRPTPRW